MGGFKGSKGQGKRVRPSLTVLLQRGEMGGGRDVQVSRGIRGRTVTVRTVRIVTVRTVTVRTVTVRRQGQVLPLLKYVGVAARGLWMLLHELSLHVFAWSMCRER